MPVVKIGGVTNPCISPATAELPTAPGPTRIRYLIVALLVGMAIILYLHRFALTDLSIRMAPFA